ncbi:hypothetical protein GGS24DRAFT_482539 [Hypoxylon argillaceum]|nr:hypothetical protein GGS24DRAFT_482539 [Hypoxylon argillaceum]
MSLMSVAEVMLINEPNSSDQESNIDSSEPETRPVTPELRSRPTPDSTPGSLCTAPGNLPEGSVRRGYGKIINPVTASTLPEIHSARESGDISDCRSQHSFNPEASGGTTSIRDHSSHYLIESSQSVEIEDSDHCSHYSTQSEVTDEVSARPTLTPTPVPYPDQEERGFSVSFIESIYHKVIRRFTLARRRKSRADDARVQDTIDLIKSIPTIRRTRSENLKRKLSAKQYTQLLLALNDPGDNRIPGRIKDKLRFDYTRFNQQLEIRMSTVLHSRVSGLFMDSVAIWRNELQQSKDKNISNAAKSSTTEPELTIWLKDKSDTKTPDCSMTHECQRESECRHPTLAFEVSWTETREELRKKAERYIRLSDGAIRTVVAVSLHEMWKAEKKNESRLEKMYRKGEVDENGSYSYCDDENNLTGSASIIVWRARKLKNIVTARKVEETMFRDNDGNPIQSALLQLPLQDFICIDMAAPREKKKGFNAPLLEISSERLCERIEPALKTFRKGRPNVVKENLEKKVQAKREEEERKEERLRKAAEAMAREASDRTAGEESQGRFFDFGRLRWRSARNRGES